MNEIIENNENIELNDNINEDRIWKVYLHTVPKEISGYDWDKYYVGITHRPTKIRWGLSGQGYKGQFFYNAIQKYGWENIKHEVLIDNLTEDEACKYEINLIEKLNSCDRRYGYNAHYGGNLGGTLPLRIAQYDLEGNYIKTYRNRKLAEKEIGGIISVGEGINSHGYQWIWLKNGEDAPKSISEYVNYSFVRIAQYDLEGNFIKIYESTSKAQIELQDTITIDCGASCGYIWKRIKYGEEIPIKIEPYSYIVYKRNREIEKYDLKGNLLFTYSSAKEANDDYPTISISLACRKDSIMRGGFQWKYKNDDKIIQNLSNNPDYCDIFLYTLDGKFIEKYESLRQAQLSIGLSGNCLIRPKIFKSLYINSAFGYRWTTKYYDSLPNLIDIDERDIPVVQIDNVTNNIIDIFPSAAKAGKFLNPHIKNGNAYSISACCRNKLKTSCGYKWKYLKDINELQISDSFLLEKYRVFIEILNIFKEEK